MTTPITGSMAFRSASSAKSNTDSSVILNALEQSKTDQVTQRIRLEAQVQEREEALFKVAEQNAILSKKLDSAIKQAEELKNKAEGLADQLNAEKSLHSALKEKYRIVEGQGHILKAESEIKQREKSDIARKLNETETRIKLLEQRLLQEKNERAKQDQINQLRIQQAQLETKAEKAATPQLVGVGSATVGGFAAGGPAGGFFGFIAGIIASWLSPCRVEEIEYLREIKKIQEQINKMDG